jgi:hypothetical protein
MPKHLTPCAPRLLRLDEPGEAWGLLRPYLAHRVAIVAAYARTLNEVDFAERLADLASMNADWVSGALAHGTRPPCLLVFSWARPAKVLARWPLPETDVAGIYCLENALFGEVLLVVQRLLPRIDGTSVLRLAAASRAEAEAADRLAHVLEDRDLSPDFRQSLLEALADGSLYTTPAEQRVADASLADLMG